VAGVANLVFSLICAPPQAPGRHAELIRLIVFLIGPFSRSIAGTVSVIGPVLSNCFLTDALDHGLLPLAPSLVAARAIRKKEGRPGGGAA
jgi:hypothetical protein